MGLRVLVVDDHALVRAGLRVILEEARPWWILGEASNGIEALEMARGQTWDLVLLDITMPGQNGLRVLRQLKREQPGLPVVMLSMHASSHYVENSRKAGANGYLTKESAPEELLDAIEAVLRGETYFARRLGDGSGPSGPPPADDDSSLPGASSSPEVCA